LGNAKGYRGVVAEAAVGPDTGAERRPRFPFRVAGTGADRRAKTLTPAP
jgi:hypothetical protein